MSVYSSFMLFEMLILIFRIKFFLLRVNMNAKKHFGDHFIRIFFFFLQQKDLRFIYRNKQSITVKI